MKYEYDGLRSSQDDSIARKVHLSVIRSNRERLASDHYVYCIPLYTNIMPSNLRQDHPRTRAFSYAWSLPVT